MSVFYRWIAVALLAGICAGIGLSHLDSKRIRPPSSFPSLALVNEADRPPLKSDRQINHNRDKPILRDILPYVFPNGVEGLSDEDKCLRVMRYVSSSIKIGPVNRYMTSGGYLVKGQASCGGFAMAFSDLVRSLKIPARYLGVFGFPQAGSHALAEAYYDGAWHMYDATFAIFFYSRPEYDGTGHVLSAKEIMTAAIRPTMMQVVSEPWRQDYPAQKDYGVRPVATQPTWNVLTYWNEVNRLVAFPVAFGNESSVSFPVRIDLREATEFRVGAEDRSWKDVYLESARNPSVGYFYLGGVTPTAFSTLEINVPVRSQVEIIYLSKDDDPPPLKLFPLDSMYVISHSREGRRAIFRVLVNRGHGIGLVWCLEGVFWVDALFIRRVGDHPLKSSVFNAQPQ